MQQLTLITNTTKPFHGGSLQVGKRKSKRPLSSKKPIHLVLKSNKEYELTMYEKLITERLNNYSQRFGIRIYSFSIQKDHIHICLRAHCHHTYKSFVRCLSAGLARKIGRGLWALPPFTRVGEWGRGFQGIQAYIRQNELEKLGVIEYQTRKHRYK